MEKIRAKIGDIEDAIIIDELTPTPTEVPEGFTVTEEPDTSALEERYKKMIQELCGSRGWSPRKARRYLDSMARRKVNKVIKRGRKKR